MPSSKKRFERITKPCETCGESIVLKCRRDLERKKFCSRSCSNKAQWYSRKERTKECVRCGTQFNTKVHNQVYCSSLCNDSDQVSRSYKMLHNNPEKYLRHALYKKGREALSIEFMLELLERQGGRCAISGQELTFIKVPGLGKVNTNASIDQVKAGGGYTEDNVQLVCHAVNIMKLDMSLTELKFWCKAILED